MMGSKPDPNPPTDCSDPNLPTDCSEGDPNLSTDCSEEPNQRKQKQLQTNFKHQT